MALADYFTEKKNAVTTYIGYHKQLEEYLKALPDLLAAHHFTKINDGLYFRPIGEKTAAVITDIVDSHVLLGKEAKLCYVEIPAHVNPSVMEYFYHAHCHYKGRLSWQQGAVASLSGGMAAAAGYFFGGVMDAAFYGASAIFLSAIIMSEMNRMNGESEYKRLGVLEDMKAIDAIVESDKKAANVIGQCCNQATECSLATLLHEAGFAKSRHGIWLREHDNQSIVAVVDKEFHVLSVPYTGKLAAEHATLYASLLRQQENFVWPWTLGVGLSTSSILTAAFFPILGALSLPATVGMGMILAAYFAKDMHAYNHSMNRKALKEKYGSFCQKKGTDAVASIIDTINNHKE